MCAGPHTPGAGSAVFFLRRLLIRFLGRERSLDTWQELYTYLEHRRGEKFHLHLPSEFPRTTSGPAILRQLVRNKTWASGDYFHVIGSGPTVPASPGVLLTHRLPGASQSF